jgi:hypothetical protein
MHIVSNPPQQAMLRPYATPHQGPFAASPGCFPWALQHSQPAFNRGASSPRFSNSFHLRVADHVKHCSAPPSPMLAYDNRLPAHGSQYNDTPYQPSCTRCIASVQGMRRVHAASGMRCMKCSGLLSVRSLSEGGSRATRVPHGQVQAAGVGTGAAWPLLPATPAQ